jgi:hypothetical protein
MHTIRRPTRDLQGESSPETNSRPQSRYTMGSRQPTFPHKNFRKSVLFAQHPNKGPAIDSNLQESPQKRSEASLNPSLYLPQTDSNFYGRFITLGYHVTSGPITNPLRNRSERNKTFDLWKRKNANGWKFMVDRDSGLRTTTRLDTSTREKLRTLSLNTPVQERSSTSIRVTTMDRPDELVEYTLLPSPDHDLFQFGRDPYNNDFFIPGHTIEGFSWYVIFPCSGLII